MHRKGPNKAVHRPDGTTIIRIEKRTGQVFDCVVDSVDYPKVAKYRWCVLVGHRMIYVVLSGHPGIFMHPIIAGRRVAHADFDGLNNRRSNLREMTHTQQLVHKRKALLFAGCPPKSRFKGVSWEKKKKMWGARIKFREVTKHRYFEREIDAAKIYDRWAFQLHGEFAVLNFPAKKSDA